MLAQRWFKRKSAIEYQRHIVCNSHRIEEMLSVCGQHTPRVKVEDSPYNLPDYSLRAFPVESLGTPPLAIVSARGPQMTSQVAHVPEGGQFAAADPQTVTRPIAHAE
jgi:hypothetical protein